MGGALDSQQVLSQATDVIKAKKYRD